MSGRSTSTRWARIAASPDWDTLLALNAAGQLLFRTDLPFGQRPAGDTCCAPTRLRGAAAQPAGGVGGLPQLGAQAARSVGVAVPVSRDGAASHVLHCQSEARLVRRADAQPGPAAGGHRRRFRRQPQVHRAQPRRRRSAAEPTRRPGSTRTCAREREGLGRYPSLDRTSVYTSWTAHQARLDRGLRHARRADRRRPAAPPRHPRPRCSPPPSPAASPSPSSKAGRSPLRSSCWASAPPSWRAAKSLPPAPPAAVTEIERALQALERASGLLDEARRQRDELLVVEQKARAAAESANRAKDEFLAMLGHELRNPLAAISNSVHVLRSAGRTRGARRLRRRGDPPPDRPAEAPDRRPARRRPRDDRQDPPAAPAARPRAARAPGGGDAADLRAPRPRTTSRSSAQPAWVEGDQARIEQILTNLLDQRRQPTRPRARAIRVTLSASGKTRWWCRCADEGAGIAPEQHGDGSSISSTRADGAGHGRAGGLGIGLTLVKRLVELHGGRVSAQSEGRGRGAVFTVTLPAAAPGARREAPAALAADARTVLVVEDNADTRESLRLVLEMRGHRVLKAGGRRRSAARAAERAAGSRDHRHRASGHGRLRPRPPASAANTTAASRSSR